MQDPELLQALDYILNRSNDATTEVISEALERRRRNIHVSNVMGGMPNPERLAKEITDKINAGVNTGIKGMKSSIHEMIVRIIKEHAPELNEKQVNDLCQAWLPDRTSTNRSDGKGSVPPEMLLSMIDQFISFSHGTMKSSVDKELRSEMGAWPERYWKSFPPVVRGFITDYLKNNITEKDFYSKVNLALGIVDS
jgi:predicted CopG family antitoxin